MIAWLLEHKGLLALTLGASLICWLEMGWRGPVFCVAGALVGYGLWEMWSEEEEL